MKGAKLKILFIILSVFFTVILLCYFSRYGLRLRIGIWMLNRKMVEQEIENGVKPVFTKIPHGWISPIKQQMNYIWRPLHLKGMNYFTFGTTRTIFSRFVERSNPYSRFYQAWSGVYVIKNQGKPFGVKGENIDIESLGKLAEFDQKAWLVAMGDPAPEVGFVKFTKIDSILINGTRWAFFEGTIITHSDLTDTFSGHLVQLLRMPSKSRWGDELTKYHDITLQGIYGVKYSREYGVTFVVYGCGSLFETVSHKIFNHYDKIRRDLYVIAEGIRFIPVKNE